MAKIEREILARENPRTGKFKAPAFIPRIKNADLGLEKLPGERFYSPEFMRAEWEHIWTKTWQLVIRLDEFSEPGSFYVMDRGYASYEFFQQIIDAKASFIGRVQNKAVYRVIEQREITSEAAAAGVIEDVVVDKLGAEKHKNYLKQPVRIIKVDTG